MGLLIPCMLLLTLSGVTSTTQVINGILRGSVYFNESVADNLSLQWSFKGTQIATRVPGFPPACIPQYAGRCTMLNNGTLKLDNVTSADDGEYSFNAVLPPSTPVKTSLYNLKVYPILSPPVLSTNSTNGSLISGTYVSLHCDAGSQTVTAYTFYRDGRNICSELRVTCSGSNLYFQPVTESATGTYTCTIQNPVSSSNSNTLQVTVSVPVSDVNITSNVSGLVWPELDSVTLTCSARGTNVSYSWSLQGAPLPKDPNYQLTENDRVLTISPVNNKDNGTFTCTASNWINSQTSNGVNLSLGSPISAVTLTSNVSEGSYIWAGEASVSLNCSSDGSNVTFSWKLNGHTLPQNPPYHASGGKLLISPVSRNDDKPFTCEASNRISNKTSNALSLNVAWLPENNISCRVWPAEKVEHIKLGCFWPGGQPEANVSLIFSGQTENGTNNATLEVQKSDVSMQSQFTCIGDQLGRKSQCSVIFEPPVALEHNNDSIKSAKVGETIVLKINVKLGLEANFNWYRLNPDPVPIQPNEIFSIQSTNFSSMLQIRDVTVKDAGKYVCRATNVIGMQDFLFTVNVSKRGLGGGAIAGIVIGVLAGVTLIGIAVFFFMKKN